MSDISKKLAAIEESIGAIRENMATKADIRNMATKADIRNMATKADIRNLELRLVKRIAEKIDEAQMEIIKTVDKHKVDKENIKVLEKRVERLEDNAGLPPLTT